MQAQDPLPLIDGRFRLLRLLAIGGMGELYLAIAHDQEIEGLEQLVVIKRILPEFARDSDVVTMFLIEARIAARLAHPNVVRVFDMGQANGSLYFTMEYLHGADLEHVCDAVKARGGAFPLGHVITIILGICAGLHFAHEMRRHDGRLLGIVHRDVSPGNVFITHNGEVKLVDFGIAKVLSSRQRTEDGMLKGKLAYMSPEQVRGEHVDRRSDIFAIGILLYEMVTLTNLFDGDNEYEMMTQIATGEVPRPSTRRTGIPYELERIIMKTLSLRREDRYATAQFLAQELHEFAITHDVKTSNLALKQFLERLIGDAEYPWYLDEEGPEERAAVQNWFASAPADQSSEEVEIVDVNLDDLFETDVEDEPQDEDEQPTAEHRLHDEEPEDEPTRIAAAPRTRQPSRAQPAATRPAPARPAATRPARRRFTRKQLAAAAAGATAAALLLAWRCSPADPEPLRSPALAPPEPLPAPPTPPVSIVKIPETPPPPPPAPEPPPPTKTKKKKSAKQRASK